MKFLEDCISKIRELFGPVHRHVQEYSGHCSFLEVRSVFFIFIVSPYVSKNKKSIEFITASPFSNMWFDIIFLNC